jgi:hypothetical protein
LVAIYYDLNIDPTCHPLLLIEPPKSWKEDFKIEVSSTLMNHFNISGICFANPIYLLINYYKIETGTLIFLFNGMQCIATFKNNQIQEMIELEPNMESSEKILESIEDLKSKFEDTVIVSIGKYSNSENLILDLTKKFPKLIHHKDNLLKSAIAFSISPNFLTMCQFHPIHQQKIHFDSKKHQFEVHYFVVPVNVASSYYLSCSKGDRVYRARHHYVNGVEGRFSYTKFQPTEFFEIQ